MGARQVGAEHQRPRVRGVDALEGVGDGEIEAAEARGLHAHALRGQFRHPVDALLRHAQVVDGHRRQFGQQFGDLGAGGDVEVHLGGPPGEVVDLAGEVLQVADGDLLTLEQVEADAADALGVELQHAVRAEIRRAGDDADEVAPLLAGETARAGLQLEFLQRLDQRFLAGLRRSANDDASDHARPTVDVGHAVGQLQVPVHGERGRRECLVRLQVARPDDVEVTVDDVHRPPILRLPVNDMPGCGPDAGGRWVTRCGGRWATGRGPARGTGRGPGWHAGRHDRPAFDGIPRVRRPRHRRGSAVHRVRRRTRPGARGPGRGGAGAAGHGQDDGGAAGGGQRRRRARAGGGDAAESGDRHGAAAGRGACGGASAGGVGRRRARRRGRVHGPRRSQGFTGNIGGIRHSRRDHASFASRRRPARRFGRHPRRGARAQSRFRHSARHAARSTRASR